MKMIIVILGWIAVLALFFLAVLSVVNYNVSPSKLKLSSGVLASDPTIAMDEYNQERVMMSLQLEGEEVPVRVPGKLLNQADPKILDLKKGDRVQFYEKQSTFLGLGDQIRRLAFGLGDESQFFYSQEEAIAFYKKPGKLLFSAIFVIMAGAILYFLLKP